LTLHKGMTKDVVHAAGIATPDYAVIHDLADLENLKLPMPLFAKPLAEGTGKGVDAQSKINNTAQLQHVCGRLLHEYKQPVLVERFLPGREFTVGILGTGKQARALATMEIKLLEQADSDVYSYRNKEECEELVHYELLPAGELRRQVEALALDAWRALNCLDAGRLDVRLDEHRKPGFIEVNPLAGIHPEHSDLPIMASMVGVTYRQLIATIMDSAVRRHGLAAKRQTQAA
ncbi:MAG: hypothetical protein OQJ84_09545, partial [Xanthomonadales bacterium]|nr:hypothetical protein [Xanthomonadales bacterium]